MNSLPCNNSMHAHHCMAHAYVHCNIGSPAHGHGGRAGRPTGVQSPPEAPSGGSRGTRTPTPACPLQGNNIFLK